MLKEVARRIVGTVREVDLAARYGGEEFAILLPHTSKADARIVAERLLANLRKQEFTFGAERVRITASIGCAGNSDVASGSPEDLVKAADLALYEAKRSGRNCVAMYQGGQVEVGAPNSMPAPAMPFPPSLPAPALPFLVDMPVGTAPPPDVAPSRQSELDESRPSAKPSRQ